MIIFQFQRYYYWLKCFENDFQRYRFNLLNSFGGGIFLFGEEWICYLEMGKDFLELGVEKEGVDMIVFFVQLWSRV